MNQFQGKLQRNKEVIREHELLYIFISGLFIFIFISFYTFSGNVHGDGFRHVFISNEILKTGQLQDHMPYRAVDIKDGKLIYEPIGYPQTFYVLLSLFIMFFGEAGSKILPGFLGLLVFMFVYLLFRWVSWKYSIFIALLSVLANAFTFIGVYPRIEEYLLLTVFASIFYIYKFMRRMEIKPLVLGGCFLGMSVAIKQQGIYLSIIIIIMVFFFIVLKKLKYKSFILLLLLIMLVSSVPLYDLAHRNGTIEPVPSSGWIPLFSSKYPVNIESHRINVERINYWLRDQSFKDIVLNYVLYLDYYQHTEYLSKDIHRSLPYIFLFLIFILMGLQYLENKDKILFLILSTLLTIEIVTTYVTQTPIAQYHQVGIAIITILVLLGLFNIINKVKMRHITKFLIIAVFVLILTNSFILYEHNNFYKQEGRYTTHAIEGWMELTKFAESKISNKAIVLTGSLGFTDYSRRTTIWFEQSSNPWLFEMLTLNNVNETLCWLNYFDINYIFIDKRLVGKSLGDSFPNKGLVKMVDRQDKFFKKVFSYGSNNKEIFVLYKVNYPKSMEYCNKIYHDSGG